MRSWTSRLTLQYDSIFVQFHNYNIVNLIEKKSYLWKFWKILNKKRRIYQTFYRWNSTWHIWLTPNLKPLTWSGKHRVQIYYWPFRFGFTAAKFMFLLEVRNLTLFLKIFVNLAHFIMEFIGNNYVAIALVVLDENDDLV